MKIPRALQLAPYPAFSLLLAILLTGYFYLRSHIGLQLLLPLPKQIFISPVPDLLIAALCICVIIELRWINRRRAKQRQALQQLRAQIDELLANKKQLNTRAHVYANHADKLKLFISDKLLEYIEYDEKFLHFKSIASEVRHNGIISYDKVSTVLQQQISATDQSSETFLQLSDAQDSLHYLWDLLDLSTADNIALHIANQVCEAEELLFQEELGDTSSPLPEKPVYEPQQALEKALARCFGSSPISLPDNEHNNISHLYLAEHEHVRITCHPTTALLGNENHLILALENLIHNAQFFAGKRSSSAHITIALDQLGEHIRFRIYNSGPTIGEATASQLFQLGFSTRRAREHHGKGLGLYFVNEIVKGYDGQVGFSNLENSADVLSLRLQMVNGEVITEVIELLEQYSKPRCRKSGSDTADKLEWELYGEIASIEVTHQSQQETTLFHPDPDHAMEQSFYDPASHLYPRWQLNLTQSGENAVYLLFKPLDIQGVEFELRLPSLQARLEGDYLQTDETAMEQQLTHISGQFKALED